MQFKRFSRAGFQATALLLVFLASCSSAEKAETKKPAGTGSDRIIYYENKTARDVRIIPLGQKNGLGDTPIMFYRMENGRWRAKLHPSKPGFHYFEFLVDGKTSLHPDFKVLNGYGKLIHGYEADGPDSGFYTEKDVPHGTVIQAAYESSLTGRSRPVQVYLPPGYGEQDKKYPLLILQHGMNEDETAWQYQGKCAQIMDNLLAAEAAQPMVIAMDNGMSPGFTDIVVYDLLPFMESEYSLAPGSENRAFAGLSMGARQAYQIILDYPMTFDYVGIFSGYHPSTKISDVLLNAQQKRDRPYLWIGIGRDDFMYSGAAGTAEYLADENVQLTLHISEGAHEWLEWRNYLKLFAPKLFRPEKSLAGLCEPE